jgi:dTMP kinase
MLIDIEGIDGSGKGTQAGRLVERLKTTGVSASLISFPRYAATLFGRAVGEFLNGKFGSLADVHPFLVSLLFAGDRFESKRFLLDARAASQVVVLDRYVPSNVAHQASKLDGAERAELTNRILELEYTVFGMPCPDVVVLLDLPVAIAQERISHKTPRNYTARKADIQEADGCYLERVREVYLELGSSGPNWHTILCSDGPRIRTIDEVADSVWQIVDSVRR